MLFDSRVLFIVGLFVGLSYCRCDPGDHACGFLVSGQGAVCTQGSDTVKLGVLDEFCPAALSGPGYAARDLILNITLYSCPAAVACYLPPGLTDNAKSNDTSCPSKRSLLTSLGVYNVISAAFSVV